MITFPDYHFILFKTYSGNNPLRQRDKSSGSQPFPAGSVVSGRGRPAILPTRQKLVYHPVGRHPSGADKI